MPDLENELDKIIAREKPGYRRVPSAGSAPADTKAAGGTADLVRKYLGGARRLAGKQKGKAANAESDLALVNVRPVRESDDPRQNVSKAVVISRSKKKIIGEQG